MVLPGFFIVLLCGSRVVLQQSFRWFFNGSFAVDVEVKKSFEAVEWPQLDPSAQLLHWLVLSVVLHWFLIGSLMTTVKYFAL